MAGCHHFRFVARVAAALGSACLLSSGPARASNPLEFPDNGSASFSRGGAWVATATDPIAVHYNPAALATQSSGMSLELLFAYNRVCFDRRNPEDEFTGPRQEDGLDVDDDLQYDPACNKQTDAPRVIPSLAIVWRATPQLGVGFAVVPPASYGTAAAEWPDIAQGFNASPRVEREQNVPAPYRYMTLGSRVTLLFPTLSAGYAITKDLRVGAGFVWGVAVIDVLSASPSQVFANDVGDRAELDSRSNLKTKDLFVPGAVIGAHWSVTPNIDIGAWGRFFDAIESHEAEIEVLTNYYEPDLSRPRQVCASRDADDCAGFSIRNTFTDAFREFRMVIPPEIRAGVRFHVPRAPVRGEHGYLDGPASVDGFPTRDPLHDDIFDIELDASYTVNSAADTIRVRFKKGDDGTGVVGLDPLGVIPPNADRPTGWKDSIGIRLGGQYNIVADVLGLRAGGWMETAAADPEWLHVSPVPALRGGVGGGAVLRRGRLDIQIGYQRHFSAGMDNGGDGALKGTAGVLRDCADVPGANPCPPPGTDPDVPFRLGAPPTNQQFRTFHTVNGGSVTQSANVFTAGAVYRF